MKLRGMLQSSFGKPEVDRVIRYVGSDVHSFRSLVELLCDPDHQIAARASWCLGYIGEKHPSLAKSSLATLTGLLGTTGNSSVDRNILRLLGVIPVPSRLASPVFDFCLLAIGSPAQPIAVRAFAITVAAQIASIHRDLANELKLIIDGLASAPQTPAIRVRMRNALKSLQTGS